MPGARPSGVRREVEVTESNHAQRLPSLGFEVPFMTEIVARLRAQVIDELKRRFVGRDEVIDLIALAVVAGEHLFLLGPPGTAKSALIRHFAQAVRGSYFEYMLTRFSEPNELFGPLD